MNRKFLILMVLYCLLVGGVEATHFVPVSPQPTHIPRPTAWVNPYAYEMPYFDQGTTGTCTGAAGAYVLGILRKQAEGAQPTYVEPSVIRDQSTTFEGHPITYDILPSWYLSSRSIYAAYDELPSTGTSNTTELAIAMMLGANLESDWITPSNTAATTYYTPQSKAYLDTHRIWQTHGYSVYDGGEVAPADVHSSAEKWEMLKEGVYRNGVGGVVIPVYANYTSSNGTFFYEPNGIHIDHHWLAVVGYNDTTNVIYVMNSWAQSHPTHGKIEALTYSYWTYGAADGGKPNATIFRW